MTVLDQHAAPVTIRLAQPTANRRLTELTLTPGVVDDQAREMFLYAQCQLLALAVSEQAGWPLWVAEQQVPAGTWSWAHVGVRTPAGRWLDIEGPRAPRDVTAWLAGWGLPVRLRLLDRAAWHETFRNVPAGAPASWWRTRVLAGPAQAGPGDPAVTLVEGFASLLVTQAGGAR